jgi:hypothetical protein
MVKALQIKLKKVFLISLFLLFIVQSNFAQVSEFVDIRTDVTFLENLFESEPQLIFPSAVYTTDQTNFNGSNLIIKYVDGSSNPIIGLTQDRLSIKNVGNGEGEVSTAPSSGIDIFYEGILIGIHSSSLTGSGINGEILFITWNENATVVSINAVINQLTYFNSSDIPVTSRTIQLVINDGSTISKDLIVNITPENDAPTLGALIGDAADITVPGDPIIMLPINEGGSPGSEEVQNSIDNTPFAKYLNFFGENSGFQVTPSAGATVVSGLTLTSANDVPERDPTTYILEGSKNGATYVTISAGLVPVFEDRFQTKSIEFNNTEWYTSYRLTFPTLLGGQTLFQIGEVELIGVSFQAVSFGIGESPIIVYPLLPASDADSPELLGATVEISTGFTAGDVLGWTDTPGITGSYNSETGIITFSGAATVETYRTLLRSVTFSAVANNLTGIRIVQFQVTDNEGGNSLLSNIAESQISVSFRPTFTSVNTLSTAYLNTPFVIPYQLLADSSVGLNDQDPWDLPLSFNLISISNGTLTKNGNPLSPGSLINPGDIITWTPSTFGSGIPAFTLVAFDGILPSLSEVIVSVDVLPPIVSALNVSEIEICAGSSVDLEFSTLGLFNEGNQFTAELSDLNGDFSTPTSLESYGETGEGTFSITIPFSTPAGTGYRVRLVSSDPALTSSDNGINLTIKAAEPVTFTNDNGIFANGSAAVDLLTTTTFSPEGGIFSGEGVVGTSFDPIVAGGGQKTITYTVSFPSGCDVSATAIFEVAPAINSVSVSSLNICKGSLIQIEYEIDGNFEMENIFSAQLSNAAGDFSAPITLAEVYGNTSGSLVAIIPNSLPDGTGYRIRIVSSSSATIGPDNGSDISILEGGEVTFQNNAIYETTSAPVDLVANTITLPVGGVFSGLGVSENIFSPSVAGAGSHNLNYTVILESGCSTTKSAPFKVIQSPIISGLASLYCLNGEEAVTIQNNLVGGILSGPGIVDNTFDPSIAGEGIHNITVTENTYSINQVGEYSPIEGEGDCSYVSFFDVQGGLPIGFDFTYFGNTYNSFNISSSGFISFPNDYEYESGCCNGPVLPYNQDELNFQPRNLIAAFWSFIYLGFEECQVSYFTTGSEPNRKLVVNYRNAAVQFDEGRAVTFQIVLTEGTNKIEIFTQDAAPFEYEQATQGLVNLDGTIGIPVPNRNSTSWSAINDYVSFTPITQTFTKQVTVTAIPEKPVITPQGPTTFCAGGQVILSSSSPANNVWSNEATSSTINVTESGTYTVFESTGGCASETSDPIEVIVNPVYNFSENVSINQGESYTLPNGNLVTAQGSYTSSFETIAGCDSVYLTNVTVTIIPNPTLAFIDTLDGANVCNPFTITYNDLASRATDFTDPNPADLPLSFIVTNVTNANGTLLKNGVPVVNGTLLSPNESFEWSTSFAGIAINAFSVRAYDGVNSSATNVAVFINSTSAPTFISTANDTSCGIGVLQLEAISTGGVVKWYDAETDGNEVGEGNSFTTQELNNSTTFYAEIQFGNCISPRVPVEAVLLVPQAYYLDVDGDGYYFGNPVAACSSPGENYVTTTLGGGDCNDNNADVNLLNAAIAVSTCPDRLFAINNVPSQNYRYVNSINEFSSEYSSLNVGDADSLYWDADQVIGKPNVYPQYGDIDSAWASLEEDDQIEFLDVNFEGAGPINFIDVYETYNPGAIEKIELFNPDSNSFETVYTATPFPANPTSRIFRAAFPLTTYDVTRAKISLRSDFVTGWNEIDAIAIGVSFTNYTYEWNTDANTESILAPNDETYSVTISSGSCISDTSLTFVSTTFTNTVIANDNSCFGANDGSIEINSLQGSGPFTYQVTNGILTGDSLTNLAAGNYNIIITDANNCIASSSVTITQPAEIILSIASQTNVDCNGGSNGSATVSASGGAGRYSYSWSPSGGNGSTAIDLEAGEYIVTVTDTVSAGPAIDSTQIYFEGFEGTHNWTLNVSSGANGADPNFWKVSDAEGGVVAGGCGTFSNGNKTLHVTSVFFPDGGAAYDAGGLCGLLFCPQTNARAESPAVSTVGFTSAKLEFDFIANGDGLNDNASLLYNAGNGWTLLAASLKSEICGGGEGKWAHYSGNLPVDAINVSELRVAINWTNNDDGIGSDPSVAINDVKITGFQVSEGELQTCSATITVTITQPTAITASITETTCDEFVLNGQTYTSSGIFSQNLTTSNGCDSTLTLNLTINNSTVATLTETACNTFSLNGQTYTASGQYIQNLTNAAGCDSTLTLNLTINNSASTTVNATICEGESYTLPNDTIVTEAGEYEVTLQTINGCDSVITTTLIVNPSFNETVNAAICEGETYTLPNNTIVSDAGEYEVVLQTINGCDSVITTTLIVNPSFNQTVNATICEGESYTLPNSTIVSDAGEYEVVLQTINGCDSVITTTLIVNPSFNETVNATICEGENYTLPNNTIVTDAGEYEVTLQTINGCDSVITTTLIVNPSFNLTVNATICEGENYTLPNNTIVTDAGEYEVTLQTISGCDSVITTTLIVNPSYNTTVNAAICEGETYTLPNNTIVSDAGEYEVVLQTISGCDSVITTSLIVNPSFNETVNAAICEGETYTLPNNTIVSDAGEYEVTLQTNTGCDSVITTTLIVNPSFNQTVNATICGGENYTLPNNTIVSDAGEYEVTLQTTSGCDSVITTTLIVNPSYNTTVNATICQGETYTLPNGQPATTSGTFTSTFQTNAGCDSSIVTVLIVNPSFNQNITASICQGETYTLPNGQEVTTAGTYTSNLQTDAGCDSIITTTLNVGAPFASTETVAICLGESYVLPGGQTVTTAGTFTSNLQTTAGCDSIITTVLTVNPTFNTTVNATICQGETYTLPNGQPATTSGTFTSTFQTNAGCDSSIVTVLIVNPSFNQNITASICQGETYTLPNGQEVTTAGTYTSNLQTDAGCDSIITTTLNVGAPFASTETVAICLGESYVLPGGQTVTTAGTFTSNLQTTAGCDSIITTVLTVNPTFNTTVNATICQGETYTLPNGQPATTSGTFTSAFQTTAGCDSSIFTVLIVNPSFNQNITASICQGETYTLPNGQEVTTAGTYTSNLQTDAGCDSVIVTTLQVNPVFNINSAVTVCQGITYTLPDGSTTTTSGTYTFEFQSVNGCDSTFTLALTFQAGSTTTFEIVAFLTYTINNETFTQNAIYQQTFSGAGGCDSIITYNITITYLAGDADGNGQINGDEIAGDADLDGIINGNEIAGDNNGDGEISGGEIVGDVNGDGEIAGNEIPGDASGNGTIEAPEILNDANGDGVVNCDDLDLLNKIIDTEFTISGNTISVPNELGYTYQWVNWATNTEIPGATSSSFTPTANGFYRVFVTNTAFNCEVGSIIIQITSVGISQIEEVPIRLYPNPTSTYLFIDELPNNTLISIYDAAGRLLNNISNQSMLVKLDVSAYANGVYFVRFATDGKISTSKFVVNR